MKDPIRVLQVFAEMNRGGAETMIMNLYRNIDRSRVQFDFVVHTEEKCAFDEEIYKLGGKIYRIPVYTGRNHMTYKRKWKDFFDNNQEYKIIHGHVRSTAAIYLQIAKTYGLITLAHSHNTSSGKGVSAIVKNVLQYSIRYKADYLLACSKTAGEWLFGKSACENGDFTIINNSIDTEKFIFNENIRAKKKKDFGIEDKFIMGHVGRFHTQKNHDFLIDIFKVVNDRNENSVLILVGEGEIKKSIQEKVNKLGLSKSVIFTGIRDDIHDIFQSMDVFVFPSLYEGLPVTLIEAQASGIQCLVSNAVTEEVKISNFIEFISLDKPAEYWASQVLKYIKGYQRIDAYNVISEAGYDVKENVKWLKNFYLRLHNGIINE